MQQQLGRQARSAAGGRRAAAAQRPFTPAGRHPLLPQCAAATSNGNGKHPVAAAAAPVAKTPSPAQTARTIVDITNEGTLCSVSASGVPVGIPVAFSVDKAGKLHVHLDAGALEMSNLQSNSSCSLTVQPTALPARAVGAVTLVGKVNVASDSCDLVSCDLVMALEKCLYFGGLDLVRAASARPSHAPTSPPCISGRAGLLHVCAGCCTACAAWAACACLHAACA